MVIKELSVCKICNSPVEYLTHFYRTHKLSLQSYILQEFPKHDKWDKSPIIYKNEEQYFAADFNNKTNLIKYLTSISKEEAADYCKSLIRHRKEQKNLVYSLSQVELRSLSNFPGLIYINSLFDYYDFCAEIGLKNKFIKPQPLSLKESEQTIFCDTREIRMLKFPNMQIKKLDFADYTMDFNVFVERKSLVDLISSFCGDIERIKRELIRGKDNYIVVLVESPLKYALKFEHLPWISKKIKSNSSYLFHNIRNICQEFEKCQFLFVENRTEAKRLLPIILSNPELIKYDLQYLYDLKNL